MIAEQYRNIKPHFAGGKISPLSFRWRCILLDQDTENPPFEPCRYFVVNVFAETREQVIDCLGEEYPWCDIMVVDKAMGTESDDDYLTSWLEYWDNREQVPVREAPHGREYEKKTFKVTTTATAIWEIIVEANNEEEARELVFEGEYDDEYNEPKDFIYEEIDSVQEVTNDNHQ